MRQSGHYACVTADSGAPPGNPTPSFLDGLVGETITTVAFVWDYLRIEFQYGGSGPFFDFYVLPVVMREGNEYRSGDQGYRDALCAFIGGPIDGVFESPEQGIGLRSGASHLRVDAATPGLPEPTEIAVLDYRDGSLSVWQLGDGVFTSVGEAIIPTMLRHLPDGELDLDAVQWNFQRKTLPGTWVIAHAPTGEYTLLDGYVLRSRPRPDETIETVIFRDGDLIGVDDLDANDATD